MFVLCHVGRVLRTTPPLSSEARVGVFSVGRIERTLCEACSMHPHIDIDIELSREVIYGRAVLPLIRKTAAVR
eukprot:scaffold83113_cov32-Tisochrysis_lutea.AAC.1